MFNLNFLKKLKKEPQNLQEILDHFKKLEQKVIELSQNLDALKTQSIFPIQKIGIIRYNPFSDVGSDQSFSIALLNGKNDGIVITSLHTREENRIYAKPIKNNQSEYILSNEEKQAIEKAKS